MQVDWKLSIKDPNNQPAPASAMNEIYGYVQPEKSDQIYACGYRWDNPLLEQTRTAAIMQLDTEGDITILYSFGDAVITTTGGKAHDICRAVAFDYSREEVAFMLEATSESLRPSFRSYNAFSASSSDVTIITMDPGGVLTGAFNLNFWDAAIGIGIGGNSFFVKNEEYIFGAQSWGHKTKY